MSERSRRFPWFRMPRCFAYECEQWSREFNKDMVDPVWMEITVAEPFAFIGVDWGVEPSEAVMMIQEHGVFNEPIPLTSAHAMRALYGDPEK